MFKKIAKAVLPQKMVDTIVDYRYKNGFKGVKAEASAHISDNNSFEDGISIGGRVNISNSSVGRNTYVTHDVFINNATIGRYCSIASEVKIGLGIHPSKTVVSTHPAFFSAIRQASVVYADAEYVERSRPITIGNDVWIGTRALIMDGVTVGNGAIIGAGAVVTKDVAPYSIVGGVPAKLIRYRFTPEEIAFLMHYQWWNKSDEWLRTNWKDFLDIQTFIKKYQNEERTNG